VSRHQVAVVSSSCVMPAIEFVIGVDEVGFGALAGPLIVAAAAFRADALRVTAEVPDKRGTRLLAATDSKKVKKQEHRAALEQAIKAASPSYAVIERSPREIDEKLVHKALLEATELAISRCLEKLLMANRDMSPRSVIVLVDGEGEEPKVPCPVHMIAGGDASDWRIGSASILAKAAHDEKILQLHTRHPSWAFDKSRGYPTPSHRERLKEEGPITGVHRMSYAPVRAARGDIQGLER
jgi:ribonuclease HII